MGQYPARVEVRYAIKNDWSVLDVGFSKRDPNTYYFIFRWKDWGFDVAYSVNLRTKKAEVEYVDDPKSTEFFLERKVR